MNKDLRIIKVSLIIGIIADGLWAVALFIPELYRLLTNNMNFNPNFETRIIMGIAGSLMLGWTILLMWVLLKPIERRFILILTVPVVLCIFIITIIIIFNGRPFAIWLSIKTLIIIILMTYSYFKANRIARNQNTKEHNSR
jgi:hypothetical protein